MKLIIGLGNPGKAYAHTRHNVGWDAVSLAAEKSGATGFHEKKDFKAEIAEAMMDGEKVLFVHPLTYMNASGEAVQALKAFYKCANEDILIVHDEMDFNLGLIGFTKRSGTGGHNGVSSIQTILNTDGIPRLRLGISRPLKTFLGIGFSLGMNKQKTADFVLEPFTAQEQAIIEEAKRQSVEMMRDWVLQGIDAAMNKWHRKT